MLTMQVLYVSMTLNVCLNLLISIGLGRSFTVGCSGGTIGRRPTSDIGVFSQMRLADGDIKHISIDNAVSADHARIQMDQTTGTGLNE